MSGFWRWMLLVAAVLGFIAAPSGAADCEEGCWEACVQTYGTEDFRYKEVIEDLLEIAFEITQLKDVYNITKIGFLVDSAISNHHDVMENAMTETLESGKNIFKFELLLAMALSFIVNGQKNYFVQYDEEAAWTCTGFNCISTCDSIEAINRMSQIAMGPTSHCPGNVEAACRLTNKMMAETTCAGTNQNALVVAITNGNFVINGPGSESQSGESHDHRCPPSSRGFNNFGSSSSSSSSEEHFSPCHSYFNSRYAIGTYSGSREVFEHFPSKHGNYRYFHAEKFSYDALLTVVNCMFGSSPKCCSTPLSAVTAGTCKKTQGPLGEIVNDFPTASALASTTAGIFKASPISAAPLEAVGGGGSGAATTTAAPTTTSTTTASPGRMMQEDVHLL